MKELSHLFANNKAWANKQPAEFFKNLSKMQRPKYLWIGCSDSRVPANEILGLECGEVFVHRNVANLFPHTDFNCLSVLQYGVEFLSIEHVIVCGHYGCGGVQAAMTKDQLGLVDNWLRHVKDVYVHSKDELEVIEDLKARSNRLVECNVIQQVTNICHTSIVQNAWARKQKLSVHGWVYDMTKGRLKDLGFCISGPSDLHEIYVTKTAPSS